MIKLTWFAVFAFANSPHIVAIPETGTFQDQESCQSFAAGMSARFSDIVRGKVGLDWSAPVQVAFVCEPNGDPA